MLSSWAAGEVAWGGHLWSCPNAPGPHPAPQEKEVETGGPGPHLPARKCRKALCEPCPGPCCQTRCRRCPGLVTWVSGLQGHPWREGRNAWGLAARSGRVRCRWPAPSGPHAPSMLGPGLRAPPSPVCPGRPGHCTVAEGPLPGARAWVSPGAPSTEAPPLTLPASLRVWVWFQAPVYTSCSEWH